MKIVYEIAYIGPDPVVFSSFRTQLSSLECALTQFKNTAELFSEGSEMTTDLVLIDADYDCGEFWTLPSLIAKDDSERSIPSILLTSNANLREKAAGSGFTDFMLRPFGSDEFLIKVSTALLLSRQKDLLEEKGKLDTVLDAMQDGILVLDEKLVIEKTNAKARVFLSSNTTAFLDKLKEFRVGLEGDAAEALLQGPQVFDLERPEADSARPLILEARSDIIKDPFRKVTGVVVVLTDVTEKRKKAFQEEVFLNLISHKLKTPLSIVHKNAFLFHQKVFGPLNADQEKFMTALYEKSGELVDSFDKLLGFTMIKSCRWDLPSEEIVLEEHLPALVESQIRKAKTRKIQIDFKSNPEHIVVHMNQKYLDLVINNLLENAVKFNDKPTARISLSVHAISGGVDVEVRDNGCGIPPEDLEKVFDEFYQVDKHRTLNVAGTGLGLSIVKFLAESCGGKVSAESTLEKGSIFRVTLKDQQRQKVTSSKV